MVRWQLNNQMHTCQEVRASEYRQSGANLGRQWVRECVGEWVRGCVLELEAVYGIVVYVFVRSVVIRMY